MKTFFPTLVEPDLEDGGFGAVVLGTIVLGQGESEVEALRDAGESLQELVWSSAESDEPLPEPREPTSADWGRGRIALLQVTLPHNSVAAE